MQNKNQLREYYQKIRKEINDKDTKSMIIIDHLIKQPIIKNAKMIGCFASLPNEVQTLTLLNQNINLCFPRVQGKYMDFYAVDSINDMCKGHFNIMEPKQTCRMVNTEQIDVMLIPCIALDMEGTRIGYGQGYYDRYLSNYRGFKMALCFTETVSTELFPSEEHDIKMDMYIDENGFHII